jgi:hypothetical protein
VRLGQVVVGDAGPDRHVDGEVSLATEATERRLSAGDPPLRLGHEDGEVPLAAETAERRLSPNDSPLGLDRLPNGLVW